MKEDPFGNLTDWGPVLDLLDNLADNGKLADCQPGLVRILRYKGNWRLREEVLRRVGEIQTPSDELIFQVVDILGDDNIYYDARILAGEALIPLLKSIHEDGFCVEINTEIQKVVENLRRTPQPPFFETALKNLYAEVLQPSMMEN
ncbi:MAG: hypothetical protein WAM73_17530 [Desulfobacterales bacterium]